MALSVLFETEEAAQASGLPIVRVSWPGQPVVYRNATPSELLHYDTRDWDLPFIEPVGRLAQAGHGRADVASPPRC